MRPACGGIGVRVGWGGGGRRKIWSVEACYLWWFVGARSREDLAICSPHSPFLGIGLSISHHRPTRDGQRKMEKEKEKEKEKKKEKKKENSGSGKTLPPPTPRRPTPSLHARPTPTPTPTPTPKNTISAFAPL